MDIQVEIQCKPDLKSVDVLDGMMESLGLYCCLKVQKHRNLCIAFHELIINAVEGTIQKYGAESDSHPIHVQIQIIEGEANIKISNQALPVPASALSSIEHPNWEELLTEERGRGLLLARLISDQLEVQQDEHGVYTVEMKKVGLR